MGGLGGLGVLGGLGGWQALGGSRGLGGWEAWEDEDWNTETNYLTRSTLWRGSNMLDGLERSADLFHPYLMSQCHVPCVMCLFAMPHDASHICDFSSVVSRPTILL